MPYDQKSENTLYEISWANPLWTVLTTTNILEYFCDLSNPFYDRECNNEIIRMQRLSADHLTSMTGIEYYLHHSQEPILYIIRKQNRLSSTEVTPLAYYYIINGSVLQAPDLNTLLNSRLQTSINGLNKTLSTLAPYVRYHTADGTYSWDDPSCNNSKTKSDSCDNNVPEKKCIKDANLEPIFGYNATQVQRLDYLLSDWARKFPLPGTTSGLLAQDSSLHSQPVKENLSIQSKSSVSNSTQNSAIIQTFINISSTST